MVARTTRVDRQRLDLTIIYYDLFSAKNRRTATSAYVRKSYASNFACKAFRKKAFEPYY